MAAGHGAAHGEAGVAVRVTGVAKAFATPAGPRRVLDRVDLEVGVGELVAIAGRSGSGKTTLLTVLAGWEAADAGEVAIGDGPVGPARPWAEVAFLPQTLGLLGELSIVENVVLPARLGRVRRVPGGDADDRWSAAGVMARLGIDHLADRYPHEVSLGEQQRAALARVVAARPQLVLADEPVAHQNVEWAQVMVAVVRELVDAGSACVLATHDSVAFTVADRVLDLRDGRLGRRATDAPPVVRSAGDVR